MRRREFITLIGGGAALWPLVARAQQPDQIKRIGLLMGVQQERSGDPGSSRWLREGPAGVWMEGGGQHPN